MIAMMEHTHSHTHTTGHTPGRGVPHSHQQRTRRRKGPRRKPTPEWTRYVPAVGVPTMPVAATQSEPTPHTYAEPIRRKKTRPQARYERHLVLWRRYLRRYGRAYSPDHPIHHDIRFWEAKRCRVNVEDLSEFIFFFSLHPFVRCEIYRLVQEEHRRCPWFGME